MEDRPVYLIRLLEKDTTIWKRHLLLEANVVRQGSKVKCPLSRQRFHGRTLPDKTRRIHSGKRAIFYSTRACNGA